MGSTTQQLPIASVGRGLAPGELAIAGSGVGPGTQVCQASAWSTPVGAPGKNQAHFQTPSFSIGVSEIMSQGVGSNCYQHLDS